MDRLISLEPSNLVAIRIKQGQRCYGALTLRNVMHTMPVAFQLQPVNKTRYTINPQTGIISPLGTLVVEITYECSLNSILPELFPYSEDSFLLHSVVVPGAAAKNFSSTYDPVPNDWFTTRKKQVFIDSGIKIMFVGSPILVQLVANGAMDQIRDVLERSNPTWKAAQSVNSDGQTLLHLAIAQSRPELVQLLLEFEPDVEAQSGSGSTALEAAAASGQALIVELLLAHGANVEKSQSSNWGPIHFASGGGYIEVLKLLLLKKANVDVLTEDGDTALHIAVEKGKRDCARLLLANGATANIRNTDHHDTPLHIASALGDEHLVKLLLQKGANAYIRNQSGKTAYDVAAEHGHTRLFDPLRLGESLSIAARKGEVRTIQKLLQTGASINGRDQHGWTTLHRASFKGQLEAVRLLIEKGVDINARDEDGYSALLCAVESGHVEIIELLIKKGADVEARTNKGVSAMFIAESLQYTGVIRVLLNGGATNSFSLGKGKDRVTGSKKKTIRSRALRSSFDQSMALAVT